MRAGKIWKWTVASKHVIIECKWTEPENFSFKLNCREKFFGKFWTFPPNSSKLRSDYLFSFQKRTNYLFPAFSRSEYFFPKSARPPPLRIKWSSPNDLHHWHHTNLKAFVSNPFWHNKLLWHQFLSDFQGTKEWVRRRDIWDVIDI